MKCPHCKHSISLFSKALNSWGDKSCPACSETIRLTMSIPVLLLVIFPLLLAGFYAAPWISSLGVNRHFIAPLLTAVSIPFALRIKA